jgi:hypothetical protein
MVVCVDSRETGNATKMNQRLQPQGRQQAMRLSPAIRATLGTLLLVPFLSGCSLLFVNGAVSGWETANADDLSTLALTQPCTNSKTFPIIDGVLSGLNTVYGIAIFSDKDQFEWDTDLNANFAGAMAFVWTGVLGYSAHKGNKKVNDCRAFGARLREQRRGGAVGQASDEWLDELFPIPDFRANALFPVRSLSLDR